ncbi:NUDIX domain-containing protein [Hyphobacterium marinum]|uniref:NUDIX domain-containing protein n=1 Tax=Hyphobacterium marinum TaxID=3116574 RepID=A0ABU7LZP0_9PROT|nr:NUDIX domain-containing protein [Hyphobacterium sp. Y6023]MEE2567009.1 NUDIX domain-containing protein [Hyphobacterium sp. Y6023]
MTKLPAPTFGKKLPGKPYTKRPCAFGIAANEDGQIACVKITRPSYVRWDLPGGMQEKGETIKRALIREYAEETGLKIKVGELVARTRQYLVKPDGDRRFNRSSYFEVEIRKKAPEGKAEDDHELVWLDPVKAQRRVRDDAAAWAIAAWLRARARPAD